MPADVPDEILAAQLRQAKKKPRNFVLVVKGSKALKLMVSKKPIKTGEIQEAKTQSKGTDYYKGICQGDGGVEIVFKLVGDEPSVKTVQFKELIAEQTGLTVKPRFELVTQLAEIDDDEVETPEAESERDTPVPPAPPLPPTASSPGTLEQQVRQGLAKVLPLYDQALNSPAVAEPTKTQLLDLRQRIDSGIAAADWKSAAAVLSQIVPLVKPISQASAVPQSDATASPFDSDWQRAKEAWEQAAQQSGEQVNQLAAVLGDLETDDLPPEMIEDLKSIAQLGLPALTKNLRTPLVAAILDVERAPDDKRPALAAAGAKRVNLFLQHLAGDPAIAAVDQNPFGVKVTMRATLEPPLTALGRAFERMAAGVS